MNIVKVPEILLPTKSVDLQKWAVVACDQFTSQPEYWTSLKAFVGDAPSALNLIYPEVYLGQDDDVRISSINSKMREYLNGGVFDAIADSFVLLVRDTPYTTGRAGLVISVDLDAYDYKPFSKAYIKATEGTVVERIPPRVKIRGNAPLELPHIMLLIDDADGTVIEPLVAKKATLKPLYDFDLNMNGGHIAGYRVTDTKEVIDKLYALLDETAQVKKYGKATDFLFAVGDGNHSLATAKAHWENVKATLSDEEKATHPARYALVEVMNLHSDALKFEPIHRVVFNGGRAFADGISKAFSGNGSAVMLCDGKEIPFAVSENNIVAIKQIQDFIDDYIKNNPSVSVDYVHGLEDVKQVAEKQNAVGIVMPTLKKAELFEFIIKSGVLPRKSFSMGEAVEKRYYVEAKKIVKQQEV